MVTCLLSYIVLFLMFRHIACLCVRVDTSRRESTCTYNKDCIGNSCCSFSGDKKTLPRALVAGTHVWWALSL